MVPTPARAVPARTQSVGRARVRPTRDASRPVQLVRGGGAPLATEVSLSTSTRRQQRRGLPAPACHSTHGVQGPFLDPGFFRAVRGGGHPDAASADDLVAAVTVSVVPGDVARAGCHPHRELRPTQEPVLAGTCWRTVRGCRRRRPPAATRCRRSVARGRPGVSGRRRLCPR